ncbi:UNVERIFIED_ORG: hypothetical protein ABIC48_000627 [Burkholderia territorii]
MMKFGVQNDIGLSKFSGCSDPVDNAGIDEFDIRQSFVRAFFPA